MSSPRRSKRKCQSDYASPDGRPRIEVNDTLKELKSIGPIRAPPNHSTSSKLLELCFQRMTPHIWYRLIPVDLFNYDDFAFSVGQPWDLLRPLLIHLGYLLEISGELKINVDKFANLQHVTFGKNKFHMSNTHFKGETKNYFVCIGKPHFSGPTKQIKAISNGAFASASIRYMNASDTSLGIKLQEHIDVVLNDIFRNINSRDKDRINTLATTKLPSAPSEAPIQPPPPSSTKISEDIDKALALDLRVFPQPNRHDGNKTIPIKQTSVSNQCTKLIVLITAEK